MLRQRLLSLLLMGGGLCSCLAGLDRSANATCEMQGPFFPMVCEPAHQLPPGTLLDPPLEVGCTIEANQCVPPPTSHCGYIHGYGHGMKGECILDYDESEAYGCIANYAPTILMMRYHRSECRVHQGICQCVWVIGDDGSHPDQFIQICDCMMFTRW